MKNLIINGIVIWMVAFAPQITQAQGTIYLSSLSQTSTGSASVGSDSWLAEPFETGNDASGYVLNSIQLGMTDASGNPSGFTVMVYTRDNNPGGVFPGSSLATLNGSLNPVTSGVYTYADDSNITLSPQTFYFIMLTAGTSVANGAYSWSESAYPPNSIGVWNEGNGIFKSSNGISGWSVTPYLGIGQLAINATAVPEPGGLCLFVLGGLLLGFGRWKAKAV
jgi:hypothetical protein